ncbi:AtuA-related protein [Futiania mangrovi]|uniref:AtuA-like ferredoxin-fold domain-containing protein n=1 Tax=Futiania mangrovi TaxID=2959716 RepID=A0A9J6PKA3_9PROT|nr:hypothetical protein [Futiania mangrovii]MCP1336991.1 hypothetical protein [Futiania mangrovii]
MHVSLRELAHSRSGDKGNTLNIAVIAYEAEFYPHIEAQITEEAVARHYAGVVKGRVTRYAVDRLGVLNFVCEGTLGGGVSRNLCLDNYGKALASGVLTMTVEIPDDLAPRLRSAQTATS